jgi:hypothetical protein
LLYRSDPRLYKDTFQPSWRIRSAPFHFVVIINFTPFTETGRQAGR